jgi:peptidoglycan/LPS O-acetylase OafA/YrhL
MMSFIRSTGPADTGSGRAELVDSYQASPRRNAFGLMRLLLAGLVIVSHAFPLGGFGVDPTGYWTHSQVNIGFLALLAFFVLSGYLITDSMRKSRLLTFLWHRGLRILPGFWAVLVFGAVVVGPLAWTLERGSIAGYWTLADGGPVTYLLRDFSTYIGQFGIHDIFLRTPYGQMVDRSAINGSIWSLYFEMRLYLTIAVLGWLKVLNRARWLVPLGAVAALAATQLVDRVPVLVLVIHGLFGPGWGPRLAALFLLGASAALYSEELILDGRLAGLAAIVATVTLAVGGFVVLGCICYAYLIVWLCLRAPRWSWRMAAKNDISYGLYLYAFPIQVLLTVVGVPKLGLVPYIALTVLLTTPLAIASWLFVERPALRLKSRGPGRRLAEARGTNSAGPARKLTDDRRGVGQQARWTEVAPSERAR